MSAGIRPIASRLFVQFENVKQSASFSEINVSDAHVPFGMPMKNDRAAGAIVAWLKAWTSPPSDPPESVGSHRTSPPRRPPDLSLRQSEKRINPTPAPCIQQRMALTGCSVWRRIISQMRD